LGDICILDFGDVYNCMINYLLTLVVRVVGVLKLIKG